MGREVSPTLGTFQINAKGETKADTLITHLNSILLQHQGE